jgi:HAE1 family hydrophobic/amphiphilic exporter-1
MNISKEFIARPIMTTLAMSALVIFGVFGYVNLPVSELPNIDYPIINVSASLPGADPETMASAIATPLESAFSSIQGIDTMTSSSGQGNTNITIQFRLDRDVDSAAQDVQAAISSAQRRLPRGMLNPPSFRKNNPSDTPILFITLYSDVLPLTKVNEYADTLLARQLSTLEGVGQVNVMGASKYAVRIQADPAALAARQIGINQLAQAAAQTNVNQATGSLNGPTQTAIIHTEGQLHSAEAFRRQIIAYRNGAPVRLGDVATVLDSTDSIRSVSWFNGKPSITVSIQRQPGSNTIATVDAIKAVLPQFQAQLPDTIKMEVFYDRSQTIRASVHDVEMTLLIAAALVVGVIFVFLRRVTATIIPSLALPIALIGTFAGMSLFGFSLDNLSLMALTLSVGFVVDDAIVMLENIVRHIEHGEKPLEAALKGSEEIGFTILSMTVSLAAVFIPIVFMSGLIGLLLHEFAVVIIMTIMFSGLVSVTLTPMLCARLLKDEHGQKHGKFYEWSENTFNAMHHAYDRSLRWAMANKPVIMGIFFASIFVTGWLFYTLPQDFLPADDAGQLRASVQVANGTSYEQNVAITKQVDDIIRADPNVLHTQANVGGGFGGGMTVILKPLSERSMSAEQIARALQRKTQNIPGASVFINNPPSIRIGGRGGRSTYQYTLQGLDLAELTDVSKKLVQEMSNDPTFIGVNSDQDNASPSVQVDIDRDRAAALGVTPDQIESALGAAFGGQQISQIYASSDQYSVILEVLPKYQESAASLNNIYIAAPGGVMVPLSSVTRISRSTMPQNVNHSGQLAAVTVSFNLANGKALSDAVAGVNTAVRNIGMPPTVQGSFAGTAAAFQQSTANMTSLLLIAVIVVYIILGILYESFIHPLTILSGLPSAAMGALLTLGVVHLLFLAGLLTVDMPMTIYAFIGMIMLIGIVKKNAIMMIDFALQRQRNENVPAEQAIIEAAFIRFRPIMMTTMAALMGTLPIAFGSGMGADSRRPLGLCVTGGLLLSQALTLYITPVIYVYLDRFQSKLSLFGKKPTPEPAE